MRLSCPQCHTEYEVPEAALTGRSRTLRCADCGTKWKTPALETAAQAPDLLPEQTGQQSDLLPEGGYDSAPESFEAADSDMAEPEPAIAENMADETPIPRLFEPVAPILPGRKLPAAAQSKSNRGLAISILLVVVLVVFILVDHRAIGHAWPPSLRLFSALGLH